MMMLIIFLLVAYLIGSFPTGYWFAKIFYGVDIREHGSGNIGATNVGRILGKKFFFLVMAIDASKAFVTLTCAKIFASGNLLFLFCVAATLLLGNAHSIFLRFRGGKGVATSLGVLAFFMPFWLVLFFAVVWGLTFSFTRAAFFASLLAAFFVLLVHLLFFGLTVMTLFLVFLLMWLTARHKINIFLFLNRS